MGGYSGVKGSTLGMFLQVKVGKGACEWEGRGGDLPTEGSGTHTQRQDGGHDVVYPPT